MQTRLLGRTGHASSLAILGGILFHFLDEDAGAAALDRALAAGVNHIDIAPGYGNAEVNLGPLLPAVRDRVFVSEKTALPDRDSSWAQLNETLTRLRTDAVDLYQLHGVTTLADLDSREGAVATLLEAREQGLCRWIGITGHNLETPATQAEAVRRYDLDTVMFPIYPRLWADPDYRRDAEALLALCQERDLGVMVIKAAAARPWDTGDRHATTWYEPASGADQVTRGVRFALSQPGVTGVCTPGDATLFPLALEAAECFVPMSGDEQEDAVLAMAGESLIFPLPA